MFAIYNIPYNFTITNVFIYTAQVALSMVYHEPIYAISSAAPID